MWAVGIAMPGTWRSRCNPPPFQRGTKGGIKIERQFNSLFFFVLASRVPPSQSSALLVTTVKDFERVRGKWHSISLEWPSPPPSCGPCSDPFTDFFLFHLPFSYDSSSIH